jgi:RNA-binding protein YhbY
MKQLKHATQAWHIWKKMMISKNGLRSVVSKELRKALYNAQISIT